MSGLAKKLEVVANVAIIVVALFLGVILLQMFVLSPRNAGQPEIAAGTKVSLDEVQWEKSKQTLVLALAVGCGFCTESAPFYQQLVKETANKSDVQLIAVLPQEIGEARQYLDSLKVSIKEVRQHPLSSLNVVGTPTLILVNNKGEVTDSWIGRLQADEEAEVLKRLR
ncbi:MAG: redoxin family protein [Luteitalea sp.]|nr:redoxin family protein [Luteitalea sp.]